MKNIHRYRNPEPMGEKMASEKDKNIAACKAPVEETTVNMAELNCELIGCVGAAKGVVCRSDRGGPGRQFDRSQRTLPAGRGDSDRYSYGPCPAPDDERRGF